MSVDEALHRQTRQLAIELRRDLQKVRAEHEAALAELAELKTELAQYKVPAAVVSNLTTALLFASFINTESGGKDGYCLKITTGTLRELHKAHASVIALLEAASGKVQQD